MHSKHRYIKIILSSLLIATLFTGCGDASIDDNSALAAVFDDINGNADGVPATAEELNAIPGVSGAVSGTSYAEALAEYNYVDSNNPTPKEIQAVIDAVNAKNHLADDNVTDDNTTDPVDENGTDDNTTVPADENSSDINTTTPTDDNTTVPVDNNTTDDNTTEPINDHTKVKLFPIDEDLLFGDKKCSQVIVKTGYTTCYDYGLKALTLNAYELDGTKVNAPDEIDARPDFFSETDIPQAYRAEHADYTGYDRGHMRTDASSDYDEALLLETYSLGGNILPQWSGLNRYVWSDVERHSRIVAKEKGILNVINIATYDQPAYRNPSKKNTINMAVPSGFYKILYTGKGAEGDFKECYYYKNIQHERDGNWNKDTHKDYLVDCDTVEVVTEQTPYEVVEEPEEPLDYNVTDTPDADMEVFVKLFPIDEDVLFGKEKCSQIIENTGYKTCYDYGYKALAHNAYELDGAKVNAPDEIDARPDFFPELQIPEVFRAEHADYTGYDRGHMRTDASSDYDEALLLETYSLGGNILPQWSGLNRYVWSDVERHSRIVAKEKGILNVINIATYDQPAYRNPSKKNTINMAVPSGFYKILYTGKGAEGDFKECYYYKNIQHERDGNWNKDTHKDYLVDCDTVEIRKHKSVQVILK